MSTRPQAPDVETVGAGGAAAGRAERREAAVPDGCSGCVARLWPLNRERIHSSLGYLTPTEFEQQWRAEKAASPTIQ
jgi:hypothetical protein